MNLKELKELIEIFNESKAVKLSLKKEDFEVKIEKESFGGALRAVPQVVEQIPQIQQTQQSTQMAPQKEGASCDLGGIFIQSPMVGTFYRCPSPDAPPYVNAGDTVRKGQVIGIVEAMKIMNEIEAEFDCKIISIEANDAQPVEFGTNLIKIEKI